MLSALRAGWRRCRSLCGRPAVQRALPWLLAGAGVLVRVWAFGAVPAGLNQDEAFAGYEAFSLLHYGIDSAGYHWPVYLVAWGSGMNALESYLMMPFIALLGLTGTAIRLPQLLLGCLTLPLFYLLLKALFGRRTALIGLGLLAISPWHIMLCRWGLESNLAPFFLLLGLYGFVRGLRDARWWVLSAAAYGVSLYAYAINWAVVPLTLALFLLCLLRLRPAALRTGWLAVSAAVLFALALPLLLFVLVNRGLLPEIVTPFFSVPRLPVLRAGEFTPAGLLSWQHWRALLALLFPQKDGLLWNSTHYGLFYAYWSAPFVVLGMLRLAVCTVRRKGEGSVGIALLPAGFAAAAFVALLLTDLNVNKGNALHLYTLIFITLGVDWLFTLHSRRALPQWLLPAARCALALVICLSFPRFCRYYFTGYNSQIAAEFHSGLGQAVTALCEEGCGDVWVEGSIPYPLLLFYEQTPAPAFRTGAVYAETHGRDLALLRFGRYTLGRPDVPAAGHAACLIPAAAGPDWAARGYALRTFGTVAVATPPA